MKNHPAFDCQSLPATAPVEDMAAPQNQIPSSHAKYAGRFETKKRLRLPEGCFRIAHMWLDEKLLGFFGKQLSENHLFHGRFVLEITGSEKNNGKVGRKINEKNQDVRPVIVFCFGALKAICFVTKSHKFSDFPPKKNLAARKHSNTVGSCCSTMLPCLQPAEVRS